MRFTLKNDHSGVAYFDADAVFGAISEHSALSLFNASEKQRLILTTSEYFVSVRTPNSCPQEVSVFPEIKLVFTSIQLCIQ